MSDATTPPAKAKKKGRKKALRSADQLEALNLDVIAPNKHRMAVDSDAAKEALAKPHAFWDTQPVRKMNEFATNQCGPLDEPKTVADVRPDPYPLGVDGFEWCNVDLTNTEDMDQLYRLLAENYVEDNDCQFRFDYSRDFLKWSMMPPGHRPEWLVGVRAASSGALVAFISAIPVSLRIYRDTLSMVEINFLCVHKKLRAHRMAPLLIKEITRRVNLQDIWQATFTAGKVIPRPIAKAQYFHRSLNPRKLVGCRFSPLPRRVTLSMAIKAAQVPDQTDIRGWRPMEARDIPAVVRALRIHHEQYHKCYPHFDEEDVRHWLMPIAGVVSTYVVEHPDSHKITDMVSYYALPSSVLHHPTYKTIHAAYGSYMFWTKHTPEDLMRNALIAAVKEGFDLFNCLNVSQNSSFLTNLRFGEGDGYLHYYLFNWKCPPMPPSEMGLVMM